MQTDDPRRQGNALSTISAVLKQITACEATNGVIVRTIDFGGEPIGAQTCVPFREGSFFYAQRAGHSKLSRFGLGVTAAPTSKVTVVLKRVREANMFGPAQFRLSKAYFGDLTPPEPGSHRLRGLTRETEISLAFWSRHVRVPDFCDPDGEALEASTITNQTPAYWQSVNLPLAS